MIDDARVLTVAHVVAGAGSVVVRDANGEELSASIIRLDTVNDLALLDVQGIGAASAKISGIAPGTVATVVGATVSGTEEALISRRLNLLVEEVGGTDSAARAGYELVADIDRGDSGAGLFADDESLVGIVFASSVDRVGFGWATAGTVILAFLDPDSDAGIYSCEPGLSRVMRVDSDP